jgi:asparagine synthase (glutamine-hydrolysing)
MCGIAGQVGYGKNSPNNVNGMLSILSHRGGESCGIAVSDLSVIGNTRLAITDIHTGSQPFSTADGTLDIVFNGEIYNYKELYKYIADGSSWSLNSVLPEIQIIAALYCKFGSSFVKLLNGMFAIAIWDRNRETLILLRDRFGEKPLWYHHNGNFFTFASELKALKPYLNNLSISSRSYLEFTRFGYVSPPHSIYENIHQILPGTYLEFHLGKIETRNYWSPEFCVVNDVQSDHFDSKMSKFDQLFRDAIAQQVSYDHPNGIFLSGGIDSSLVAVLASKLLPSKLETFSLVFDSDPYPESKYSQYVAGMIGSRHHEIRMRCDAQDISEIFNEVLDQPFADNSILAVHRISKVARNITPVVLTGDGADELFGGYPRYLLGRKIQVVESFSRFSSKYLPSISSMLERIVFERLESRRAQSEYQLLSQIYIGLPSVNTSDDYFREQWKDGSNLTLLQRMQKSDFYTYLPGGILFKNDISSMANNLELRSPFLDKFVAEFALGLKDSDKINNGVNKYILKEYSKSFFPNSFIFRKKRGFSIPRDEWLNSSLRNLLIQNLTSHEVSKSGLIDTHFVLKTISNSRRSIPSAIQWQLLVFSSWIIKEGSVNVTI